MKTAELTGAELDYWVARALGWEFFSGPTPPDGSYCLSGSNKWAKPPGEPWQCAECWGFPHAYSTDWARGGPLIEREEIDLNHRGVEVAPSAWYCVATSMHGLERQGHTPLIAAMRAFVAHKFGDEVKGRAC